jgi:hypothetical protein
MGVQEPFKNGLTFKDTRAREEIRALARRRECDLFRSDQERFFASSCWHKKLSRFCFASTDMTTSKPNTKTNRRRTIGHRIAWTPKSVLYSGFANAKQLCK